MGTQDIIALIIEILFVIMIIEIIFIIIMENRNPLKTLSWMMVLIFLPVVGLLLYFFFGEEHRKKYKLLTKHYLDIKEKFSIDIPIEKSDDIPEQFDQSARMLKTINDAALLGNNKIVFFSEGIKKFTHFFEDIKNAIHHVHILYYKIYDDNIGNQLKQLLIQKAAEGVEVRLIYDDVGSLRAKKSFFEDMKKNGVKVESYLEVRVPRLSRSLNYRNHRKLAIIDGKIGYIGGMNVGNCYVEGVKWGIWRDMHIRIEGNGVLGLQKIFSIDWHVCNKTILNDAKYYPYINNHGPAPMQIISSGPVDVHNCIERGMFQAINVAKENIYIQTPYFIPSENILYALQTAAIRGVEIHIMIPKKSDNFFVDGATYSFVRELLRYNINVYLFNAGFIHSKCIVIDQLLTITGSANMDIRSFELSFETSAFIYDKNTAIKAVEIFSNDTKLSDLVNPDEWIKRPVIRRFFESVMHIFTPLL